MLNKEFGNVLKEKNFELFEKEASFDIAFLKKLLPYLSYEKLYKIDIEGYITKKSFIPLLKLLELYFCEKRKELLKDIFNYLIKQKSKIRFKKVFRYSSTELEKVKENFFKTLINKDINFSLRYGKELFLRSEPDFEKVLLKFSLFNFNYKSSFALSLIKLLKLFPQALDELMYVLFVPYCNEENNFYFYDKSYFIESKNEDKEKDFEVLISKKSYSSLKFHIQKNSKEILNKLAAIVLKDINKISLTYLMQLESLIYFSKINENEKVFENILLEMSIILSDSFTIKENDEELLLKEHIVKNIEKMLV